jgi:hypothetical protein
MHPILVAGTGSWKDQNDQDWYCPGHFFGQFLTAQGCGPTYDGNGTPKPFVWSTDLAGIPFITNDKDWAAGGAALAYFIKSQRQCPAEETALIVHSHGLQVAAYAAAEHGLKARVLISMGSPIRKDMAARYATLRSQVGYWLHVHSDGSDRFQWFGELFDGHLGIVRTTPLADRNDFVPKVGHSELLRDPQQYHHWVDRKWVDLLKG